MIILPGLFFAQSEEVQVHPLRHAGSPSANRVSLDVEEKRASGLTE
jgi:hypothetical protein